jgi:hypothetical protein
MAKGNSSANKRGPGYPPFVPTDEQRRFVWAMAGLKMTHDEIAAVIHNPTTRASIDKNTLEKHFVAELATGKQRLKSIIGSKYMERLQAGDAWAIQFGFRHIHQWNDNDVSVTLDGKTEMKSIKIEFVKPSNEHADDDDGFVVPKPKLLR